MITRCLSRLVASLSLVGWHTLNAWSQSAVAESSRSAVQNTGVSAIWILANISYAGMRAQNSPSAGWRIVSFIFGFPGTLLTLFVVEEGGCRAYGIDLPERRRGKY